MGVRAGEYGRQFPGKGLENIQWVDQMAAKGKILPYIGETFPLERVVDAISVVTERRAIGRVVVTM
jgi:NADPH2:quinone reductase